MTASTPTMEYRTTGSPGQCPDHLPGRPLGRAPEWCGC